VSGDREKAKSIHKGKVANQRDRYGSSASTVASPNLGRTEKKSDKQRSKEIRQARASTTAYPQHFRK